LRETEQKVAEILQQSIIYLALCRFEGVPLSILEAFSCGCIVAGFTGYGAREYTTVNNGFWASEDDCMDCAVQLARAAKLVTDGGPMLNDMLESGILSANYFNRERLSRRLVEFWRGFLKQGEAPQ
jgi:glycosyltransferase involved in cell wall biosynthesis